MRILINTITIMTVFAFSLTHAGEGFFGHDHIPEKLLAAWGATFFIQPKIRGQIGSAFVVKKAQDPDPNKVQLFLLASDHVVKTMCGEKTGFCSDLILSASLGMNLTNLRDVQLDSLGRTVHGVEVIHREPQPDLSMLKIVVDRKKYESINPIPFVKECRMMIDQEVFIIGFPATLDRKAVDAVAITNKNLVIRRLSKGYVVDNFTSDSNLDKNTSYWTGTTADALESNSGGPALNNEGEFFGVLNAASLSDSNGLKYTGDESLQPKKWHSLVTRCEFISDFMAKRPLSFQPQKQ